MKRVVILGAGISGLVAAWNLKKRYRSEIEITLLEKTSRVGGWIRTVDHDGFLFELGPRGIRPAEQTLQLVEELGLKNELIEANQEAKKRYLSLNRSLHQITPFFLIKHGLIQALLKDCFAQHAFEEDLSIYDFFSKRLGIKFTERFIDPLVKGIYGGDYKQLSAQNCFPTLWNAKKSLISNFLHRKKVKAPLISFKAGMETLPKQLATQLNATIYLSTKVLHLEKNVVETTSGTFEADHIISTLPGYALAKILPQFHDWLTYVTLSVVSLGWNENLLPQRGFGFLVPESEKKEILGMTWDSEIFPKHNRGAQTRLSVMISGIHSKKKLADMALDSVSYYLNIKKRPCTLLIHTAVQAIPQYPIGHMKKIPSLPSEITLLGSSFFGVSINECIASSMNLSI